MTFFFFFFNILGKNGWTPEYHGHVCLETLFQIKSPFAVNNFHTSYEEQ